ncbi:MAG: ribulokinase, partial [Acidobacteriaceae bacterium]
ASIPTSLGSGIFAMLAAGAFPTIQAAQDCLCPQYAVFTPRPAATAVCDQLYTLYRKVYFGLGTRTAEPCAPGDVLPELRRIASEVRATA